MVAIVKCNGGENAANAFTYHGNPACSACAGLLGGNKVCKTACLGCGDCEKRCPQQLPIREHMKRLADFFE